MVAQDRIKIVIAQGRNANDGSITMIEEGGSRVDVSGSGGMEPQVPTATGYRPRRAGDFMPRGGLGRDGITESALSQTRRNAALDQNTGAFVGPHRFRRRGWTANSRCTTAFMAS